MFGLFSFENHPTHQILCHLDRVHVVRVELERNRLGPVLHLTLDDVVLNAEHLQLRIALGGPIVSALLARLARQPLRNGRLALLSRLRGRGWNAGRCRRLLGGGLLL